MKLILDLDTGIDDALALVYALGHKDIDLIGVTNVFGNVTVETANKNTINILDLFNRSDVPVFKGAAKPLNKELFMHEKKYQIHGLNGIGNVELGEAKRAVDKREASDFIVEMARQYKDELCIVAVAPLTNIANAISKDKEAMESVGKIVIMGGALTVQGNATPYAEANIYGDPEAAKIVFESGVHTTMVGLDVTFKTFLYAKDIESWKLDNPRAKALYDMAYYYYENEIEGSLGGAMHDPLAVDIALHPEVLKDSFDMSLTVETDGLSAGRTIGLKERVNDEIKSTTVCIDVDGKDFINRFVNTINEIIKE
ncbi:MAG: nucleoside hydrolase [Erysipelotrichaceae bacterium]|nr:nucleoside hydrolase [Erysipelotrichaceae bacterium]